MLSSDLIVTIFVWHHFKGHELLQVMARAGFALGREEICEFMTTGLDTHDGSLLQSHRR